MISIAILEDNELLSGRLASILSDWDEVKSVNSFISNLDFCAFASSNTIDVLLADLDVEDGSGIESIAFLANAQPYSKSIVVSVLSDGESIVRAISSGAVGYLHKDDSSFEIVSSIKMTLAGDSPVSPAIARKLVNHLYFQDSADQVRDKLALPEGQDILTCRESEVLNLIAKGLSYAECATVLSISEQTVPVHIRNIYRKLQVKNRSEAVFEARSLGVII